MAQRFFNVNKDRERNHISALLDWVSYDEDTKIYDLEAAGRTGRDLGFCFFCSPSVGASSDMENIITDMLSPNLLPSDTCVSFSMLSMPSVDYRLDDWESQFKNAGERLKYIGKFRRKMYSISATSPKGLLEGGNYKPKDVSIVVSVRIPCKLGDTPEMRMRFIMDPEKGHLKASKKERVAYDIATGAQIAFSNSLKMCGLNPIVMTPDILMSVTRQIFGPETMIRPYDIHPNQLLRDQFFDADDRLSKTKDEEALIVGRNWVAMAMSTKKLAPAACMGMMSEVSGDFFSEIKNISDPFIISTHIRIPDVKSARNAFNTRYRLVLKQAQSILMHWIPELKLKHEEYVYVEDQLNQKGAVVADVTTTIIVYGKDRKSLSSNEKSVEALWSGKGFQMQRERDQLINVFEAVVPMNMSIEQFDWIGHRGRIFAENAAHFTPIYGDWKGTATSGVLLASRRGQIASIDIYNTDSNYNFTITAESGMGKTFFANDILTSVLARGGRATILDVGGGFERNIKMNNGEYLSIGAGQGQCFNPISDVDINESGQIDNDSGDKELVIDMFSLMACGAKEVSQEEQGYLERAIDNATMREGNDADALLVRRMLEEEMSEFPECGRLANGLYPYTEGRYRSFLCGRANMEMSWELGGVELQELASMPDLRLVVLAMVLNRATNQMYLTDRALPKILLADEAWDILGAESANTTAASRTLSGVTRKARKHNGATGFITQNVNDWFGNKSMDAIFNTSEWMFLLGQRDESVDRFIDSKRISLGEFETKMMKSVHTRKGHYSEVMVRMASSGVSEVMRLVVDPYSYAMQTSDAREVPEIDKLMKQYNCPVEIACAQFAVHKFGDRAIELGIDKIVSEYMEGVQKAA